MHHTYDAKSVQKMPGQRIGDQMPNEQGINRRFRHSEG
ncbi:hypothetical protein Rhow_005048 [Rhodococcus wratislaviensis]|uniref:Uncharacterized protein n=1 Tax=Rhodococcus wratislaviensis TaxID=44752 RepID=A0A402CCP1_RHOWR|nr:hypothetical protein Rhow_005048 [Rhodococcus wratislaviensis]